jgi:competence protein ComEC
MTCVQVAGLVAVLGSGGLAQGAGIAADAAATGLLESARLIELAPWLSAEVSPPAEWLLALYYGAALAVLVPRLRRTGGWLLMLAAAVMLASPRHAARDAVGPSRSALRAAILDVGQGDATLVQLPGDRALLVDAGGHAVSALAAADDAEPAFDVGDRVVLPALRTFGVTRLDAIVLTHGDPDHVGGVRGLLRRLSVASAWEGIPVPPHPGLRSVAAAVRARGMTWRSVQAGDRERFGDVGVRVLHPPPPDWERQRVRNEDSVVLEIRVGAVSLILPGDIGREGEQAILGRLEPGRLYVLKAPHHGSNTSSTQQLIDRLKPAAVIFSCGRDNRFGHPHPAVVGRYRASGAEIFSTSEDGAVFVESDGEGVEVRGWRGRALREATRRSL